MTHPLIYVARCPDCHDTGLDAGNLDSTPRPCACRTRLRRAHVLAARLLLGRWAILGSRSVRLAKGRLWPEQLTSAQQPALSAPWPIDCEEAVQVLVASVLMGEHYRGWTACFERAEREVGQ